MHPGRRLSGFFLVALSFLVATAASAQIARVFVSNAGSDLNDCYQVTTACKSLQRAVDQSPPGGEIIVLTSGGLGTATITKSLTVNAPGGVVAFNGRTINVSIGAADKVVIRGLTLNGTSFGDTNGIYFASGGTLIVENCQITGFTNGINQEAGASRLVVHNTEFRNNESGISAVPSSTVASTLTVENCRFVDNAYTGVNVYDGVRATVRNSVATGNERGFQLISNTQSGSFLMLDSCVASGNVVGVLCAGYNDVSATLRVSHCTITGNTTGVLTLGTGAITSYQTNHLWGNGTDGSFSSVVARQ